MAACHLASARLLGLVMLVSAGVAASPLISRADPAASPASGTPPLTVPRPDMPDVAARREANRARMLDARVERLHAALQLTPAQDTLWPPVAEAIHGLAEARGRGFRQQLDAVADPVDGLKMQGDHMAKTGAAMARLADATKPLVATFTVDQKGRLPTLVERAPLRKVVSRALGVPAEAGADASATGAGGASPSSAAPTAPSTKAKMAPQSGRDPDEDD